MINEMIKEITYVKIGKGGEKPIVINMGALGFLPQDMVAIKSETSIPKVKSATDEEKETVVINRNNGKEWTVLGTNNRTHIRQKEKLFLKDKYGNVRIISEESKDTLHLVMRPSVLQYLPF